MSGFEKKKNNLFIVLAGIFITNALLAEMIGVKIFSAEGTLGLQPANLNILGFTMDFNLTAGAIIWPIVFITTDLINEYFGKPGVKKISYFTAGLIAYAFVVIFLTMLLAPANFWLDAYNKVPNGNYFDIVVRMCAKAHARFYNVVIEYPQSAKVYSIRVVIIRKTEGVPGIKPAVIRQSS